MTYYYGINKNKITIIAKPQSDFLRVEANERQKERRN